MSTGAIYMRLYVGGLPYSTTDQDLISLFQQAGSVANATVIIDRETGRSKGFGFVEMDTNEDAQRAIEHLNGTVLGNRTITVNEARERPAGGSRSFDRRSSYSSSNRY